MKFIQLTRTNDEPVWVNLEHVCHIMRSKDATVLRFVAGGGQGGTPSVTVQEIPTDILRKGPA